MGTSNLYKKWVGGAAIFSGRADPVWPVAQDVAEELEALWTKLEHYSGSPSPPSVLGYRGSFLKGPRNRTWFAHRGVVTLNENGVNESRLDEDRLFEKTILASAPEGVLPASFLDSFWEKGEREQ